MTTDNTAHDATCGTFDEQGVNACSTCKREWARLDAALAADRRARCSTLDRYASDRLRAEVDEVLAIAGGDILRYVRLFGDEGLPSAYDTPQARIANTMGVSA